jgi:hypothetical protein
MDTRKPLTRLEEEMSPRLTSALVVIKQEATALSRRKKFV